MKDIAVKIEDKPGQLALIVQILGENGINIEGGCAYPTEGASAIHLLVGEYNRAEKLLSENGFEVTDVRDVIDVHLDNTPGQLAKFTKKLADADINLNLFYIGSNNRIIIGTDDLAKAMNALSSNLS